MSRRRYRGNANKVQTQQRVTEQRRVPQIRPGATNFTPLFPAGSNTAQNFHPVSTSVIESMYQHFGPQKDIQAMYAPGAPIRPIPGITPEGGPRGFAYPVAYNIAQLPRATETYSFADLRALAAAYDGVQMCEQIWFDYLSRLELVLEPRQELLDSDADMSQWQEEIQPYLDFFAYPDKEHDLHEWLCMAVRDQLEIDALSIYVRKDRAGRPFALDIIDGSLVKPLIDDRGRRPMLPYPAFEQFVYGVPACFLTTDDLLYLKETERSESVYGRSRVERIILRVNQALRKQTKDLARFTDGTVPAGVLEPSMDVNWSQEEIEFFEVSFNNLMAGNDEQRARVKVLPRGFVYKPTDDPQFIHTELDSFLLNVTAACFGLTMDELAMTQTSNRSTGQTQENVVYRRAMGPLMSRYGRLITHILKKYFKEQRFVARFRGYQEVEDFSRQATGMTTLTNAGVLGITDAGKLMKLPQPPGSPYVGRVMNTRNGPVFLDDIAATPESRKDYMDGLVGSEGDEEPGTEEVNVAGTASAEAKAQQENAAATSAASSGANSMARLMSQVEHIIRRLDQLAPVPTEPPVSERDVLVELNKWRDRSVDDIKHNRAFRGFTTRLLPEEMHTRIESALPDCASTDEVRALFRQIKDERLEGAIV